MRRTRERLEDIADAIQRMGSFLDKMAPSDSLPNSAFFWAIVKQIEIVGEASKGVPREVTSAYANVPWSDLAKTRDRFSHGYYNLSVEQVIGIAVKIRVEVLPVINEMLASIPEDPEY